MCNSEFLVWEWNIKLIQGRIIFVGRYKPAREANVVREDEMRTSKMHTEGTEHKTLSELHLDAAKVQVMLMNLVLS